MKKAFSVFLALLLAVSSIFSVLMIPAAAATDNFEDTSKWIVYDYSVSYVNSSAKLADDWAKVLENTDGNYIYEGSSSLNFSCPWQVPAYVFEVEKNTDYTLSFKYYDPTSSASSPFSRVGVINNDYCTTWENADDEAFYAYIDTNTAYTSNGSFSGRESNWDVNISTNYTPGEWNEITLNFNSGDNETLTFTPIINISTLYMDDFKLIADGTEPEPEPEPEPSVTEAGNWQVYVVGDNTVLDGTAGTRESTGWNYVMDNPDSDLNNGDMPTVKFRGSHSSVARLLKGIEKGKEYKISFKYYMPESTIPAESGESLFYEIGVAAKGTSLTQLGSARPTAAEYGDPCIGEKGKWNEYSLTFKNTTDTDKYFFIAPIFSDGYVFYISDFKIEDVTPEPEPEPEPSVTEAGNWQVYVVGNNTVLDGTAGTRESTGWNYVMDNPDSDLNNGNMPTVKFRGSHSSVARLLKDIEKGKEYKISFKYYMPESTIPAESGESLFYEIGVTAKGTSLTQLGSARPTAAEYGDPCIGEKGKWNEYSLTFKNTTDTDKYFFIAPIFSDGYVFYISDFKIEDVTPEPDPEPEPTPSASEADKWGVYINSAHSTIDGTATNQAVEGWNCVTDNTDSAYNYGDAKTLKFRGSHSTVARLLEGLEKDKSYKISFKYYIPSSTTHNETPESFFYQIGIVKKGTAISSGGGSYPTDALLYGDPCIGENDTWNEYSLIYTNWDDTEEFFYFSPVFSDGYTFYFADFKVEETYVENPGPRPFNGWGDEPLSEYLINFDDFNVNFTENYVEIVKGPARDGKASNTLHVIEGEYQNAVFPKWDTVTNYTDPVFTLPVKENTLYEYSFWIYIDKDAGDISWLQFFYDYATSGAYILLNKTEDKGKWVKYTARFVTQSGQDKISLGFNASERPYDMWIDDFRVREIAPGVLGTLGNAGYCEDMFNILRTNGLADAIQKGKSTVLKVSVANSTQYTFGIDVSSSKVSNSRIFLSYDGKTPILPSDEGAPVAEIKSNGKNGRYSLSFVTDTSGYIYIVIENNDNALSFAEPMLFESYTLSTGRPVESETPIDRELSVNKGKESLEKISTTGLSPEDIYGDHNEDHGDSNPVTGDSTAPLILLIITLISALVLLTVTKKGGEQA